MPRFENILVPTDFSENAADALALAAELAADLGASLRVVHVCQASPVRYAVQEGLLEPGDDDSTVERKVREHLERRIDEFIGPHAGAVAVRESLPCGDPAREVVGYARANGVDLIVMGRRGVTLADVVLGSTAERVVRQSSCPVLIAKRPSE